MDLRERITGFDFVMKKICAIRHQSPADMDRPIEMKREIKQAIDIPQKPSSTFTLTVTDRIHFQPKEGPFTIEVVIGGTVFLDDTLEPSSLRRLLNDSRNVNHLVSQCLLHSCSMIAHLTEKMGYGPIILSPDYGGEGN